MVVTYNVFTMLYLIANWRISCMNDNVFWDFAFASRYPTIRNFRLQVNDWISLARYNLSVKDVAFIISKLDGLGFILSTVSYADIWIGPVVNFIISRILSRNSLRSWRRVAWVAWNINCRQGLFSVSRGFYPRIISYVASYVVVATATDVWNWINMRRCVARLKYTAIIISWRLVDSYSTSNCLSQITRMTTVNSLACWRFAVIWNWSVMRKVSNMVSDTNSDWIIGCMNMNSWWDCYAWRSSPASWHTIWYSNSLVNYTVNYTGADDMASTISIINSLLTCICRECYIDMRINVTIFSRVTWNLTLWVERSTSYMNSIAGWNSYRNSGKCTSWPSTVTDNLLSYFIVWECAS